ncbi:MAG: hypothetical protein V3T56_06160 [Gemmatimonadales bacterium]
MNLAARGARNLDGGEESIEDQVVATRLRAQARELLLQSVVIALALLVVALILPG